MRQAIRVLKTPVTLILLLAILGFGASWGLQHVTMDDAPRQQAACVMTDVGTELTPDKVTVRIFNSGTKPKAASLTRIALNHYDFRVILINNSSRELSRTTIVGNSPDNPEVKLLQQFFVDAAAEGDGRADHVVDVIIHDKTQKVDDPKASVPVSGPVCLPAITAASASPSATPSKK